MQVEVRDADGNPVPDGTEGEIWLRGPQIMLGYWRDPEATAAATAPGGWFRTGDLGTMVDGHLRTSARRSDLILRGGENIYPAEVEHQLLAHPAVVECIVLGVPDRDLGQVVGAVVVVRQEGAVTGEELREYLVARLARYKVPTRWRITTEPLPRNATGKSQPAAGTPCRERALGGASRRTREDDAPPPDPRSGCHVGGRARVDLDRLDAFGLVVEVGGGVDEVVRAATHDGGVADLPDPLPPGRQASDEVTRAAGLGAGAQDWWWGSELHDGQRHLPQRGQGVQVTHLGRTCGDPSKTTTSPAGGKPSRKVWRRQ